MSPFGNTTEAMFPIFFLLFSFPSIVLALSNFLKLPLPPSAIGPESVTFDLLGQGPYTGVADGRILKYFGPNVGFLDYGFDTPTRSKAVCDGNTNASLGKTCGRPLGLTVFNASNGFYVTDAYLGLLFETFNGRLARLIANKAEGVPFRLNDGVDLDLPTGRVFFTDASANFNLSEVAQIIATNDSSGRLLVYDPRIASVTVLLRNLSAPAGVAVSLDRQYLLVTEFVGQRILKYWLQGPKANTSEILLTLPGRPDNIKRTPLGEFWVAVNVRSRTTNTNVPTAIKINGFGVILANISLRKEYNDTEISEFQEYKGKFYVGSLYTKFVGVYEP